MIAGPREYDLGSQARERLSNAILEDKPEGQALPELPPPDAKVVEQKATNPVVQFIEWIGSFAVPGIGMFMEAYFIFSVGNLKPIWAEQYPACWKVGLAPEWEARHYTNANTDTFAQQQLPSQVLKEKFCCIGKRISFVALQSDCCVIKDIPRQMHLHMKVSYLIWNLVLLLRRSMPRSVACSSAAKFLQANEGCSETFLASLSYSQVAGLFLGMVAVGFTVDRIGRKAGSITTASIMLVGSFCQCLHFATGSFAQCKFCQCLHFATGSFAQCK